MQYITEYLKITCMEDGKEVGCVTYPETENGVSYIFAGKNDIDIKLALNKLYSIFGIKKLLLEGGSVINGAFGVRS